MNFSTSLLTYPELLMEIRRLCNEKQTGTLFITSEDSHLARIVLNEGHINFLVFDTKYRGYDAIYLISRIKSGRLQFVEGVFETTQEVPLPTTDHIFHLFGEEESISTETSPLPPIPPQLREAVDHVKKALATYIGPFANIICEEYLEENKNIRTLDDISAMIEIVASEIGDSQTEQVFKTEVKQEIVQKGLVPE